MRRFAGTLTLLLLLILASGLGTRTVLAAPTFTDVPTTYWAYSQIEEFAARGITTGCAAGRFCPERGVTRAEMAVFLDRTLGYSNPPIPTSQRFTDVPPGYWAYAFIEQFATLGITTGCGGTAFCPDRGVTRAEMAAFLIRALNGAQDTGAQIFADVPPTHPQYGYIQALYNRGITTGCGTPANGQRFYCPDRGVNRAEMAVFITRAFPASIVTLSPAGVPAVAGQSFDVPIPSYCSSCSTFRVAITEVQRRAEFRASRNGTPVTAQGVYIAILMRVTNTGSNPDSLGGFRIRDQAGRSFDYDFSATSTAADFYGRRAFYTTLQPTFSADVVIVFDVAPDATSFTIVPR